MAESDNIYILFRELSELPQPYSVSTIRELWTRPHLANEMLKHHLSQESDHSSRRVEEIDRIVGWLDDQLDLAGKRVIDLGCGPGLYTRRVARLGARVTGVDFSAVSLDYARSREMTNVEYLQADYLADPLPQGFDVAVMIYYDYCAMAPQQRSLLLSRIRELLHPGGRLVLDLPGPGAFDRVGVQVEIEQRLMGGFFAAGDYVGIHKTDVYEDEWISLDRFLILEPEQRWQIFNWMQYFTAESAATELAAGGFMASVLTGGLDGTPLQADSDTIGVIAEKSQDESD